MTKLIDRSRYPAQGYKHPLLEAALVWLWFRFFLVAAWSNFLLAMLMPAPTLWIVWRLSADYLDIEQRLFGLALLTLVLFFNFHALKFNVNTMLMPLWAATTLWFMRSYATRSALYAALAGCCAAARMLGKCWSIFLIAGLVLAPHLVLLYQQDFALFSYAVGIHGAKPFTETVIAALGYLAGSIGYAAVPVIIAFAAARPCRARRHGVARRGEALAGWRRSRRRCCCWRPARC